MIDGHHYGRLGKQQLRMLAALSAIDRVLIIGDKLSASLVRRNLLSAEPDGNYVQITPTGLRAVANEIEAGRIPRPHLKDQGG